VDLSNCCAKAQLCSESYVCTRGFEFKIGSAKYLTCPGAECKPSDRNLFCDMVDPFQAATTTKLVPDKGTGECKMGDGPMSFHCEAKAGVTSLHVIVTYMFDEPVGNQILMGNQLVQGRTATINLPAMPVKAGGTRYTFTQGSRIAGRGAVHSKISIWVTQSKKGATLSTSAAAPIVTQAAKASNATKESVMRKLWGEATVGAACRTESLAVVASMLLLAVHAISC
jgi:hypothetical protein